MTARKGKEKFRGMPIKERMKKASELYIMLPEMEEVLDSIKDCHHGSDDEIEPDCFFLTGYPGSGKTFTVTYYMQDYPERTTDEGKVVPVLYSPLFSPASPKSLVSGLLYRLGDPFHHKGTADAMTTRLYELVRKCGVELLIVDEFQHIVDKDQHGLIYSTADWLKLFLLNTRIPMVLVGSPGTTSILDRNEHLKRRFLAHHQLKPFKWGEIKEQEIFRDFLQQADEHLPLAEFSNLADPEMALRLFCASEGVISWLMKILRRAMKFSVIAGKEKITDEELAKAFRIVRGKPVNPFRVEKQDLMPDKVNPFAGWEALLQEKRRRKRKASVCSELTTNS